MDIESLVEQHRSGTLTGFQLKQLMDEGKISKSERRKIIKQASKTGGDDEGDEDNKKDIKKDNKSNDSKDNTKVNNADRENKTMTSAEKAFASKSKERPQTICLCCREPGHVMKYCPLKKSDGKKKICYNCGSTEHSLKDCKEPKSNNLKFASCFICNETGHIAKNCPHNSNGLYPNGGCCHVCGKTDHLVKDCPEASKKKKRSRNDDHRESANKHNNNSSNSTTPAQQVSGDSLEDNLGISMKAMGVTAKAHKKLRPNK